MEKGITSGTRDEPVSHLQSRITTSLSDTALSDVKATNPFFRLRTKHNLTQHAVAVRAGCSRHLVIRAEQACFTDPPPVLVKYFAANFTDGDTYLIVREYHDFQKTQREKIGTSLGSLSKRLYKSHRNDLHPFVAFRSGRNLTQMAKLLCMSQSTLYRFENKPQLQKSVPDELITAFKDCGYPEDEIAIFIDDYTEYRGNLRRNYVRSAS